MRVAITGASGFLGGRLAVALCARGDDVALLSRASSVLAPSSAAILRFGTAAEAGDRVSDFAPDVLVHLAAAQGRRGETAADMVDANVTLGAALIQAMRAETLFINADTALPPEVNLYALTKRQFADLARLLVMQGRTSVVVANAKLQMIYGPGDDPAKFVPSLALQLVADFAPLVTTPATQRRDFIHIDDAVAAILAVIDRRGATPAWQDVPIGSGTAIPLAAFIEKAISASGFRQPWLRSLPPRIGEPDEMVADTSVLRALGWAPRVTLDDGVTQLIDDARRRV